MSSCVTGVSVYDGHLRGLGRLPFKRVALMADPGGGDAAAQRHGERSVMSAAQDRSACRVARHGDIAVRDCCLRADHRFEQLVDESMQRLGPLDVAYAHRTSNMESMT